jgi:hypothetical protein
LQENNERALPITVIKLQECEFDCDFDADCESGLLCADEHKVELSAAGKDERKVYCGNVGGTYDEVCYDPARKLQECEFDCDTDEDCELGLQCADAHEQDLSDAGYDERKAYCGNVGEWNDEVCFDPTIITPGFTVRVIDIASGLGSNDSTISSTTEARALDANVADTGLITIGTSIYNVVKYFEGLITEVNMGGGSGNFAGTSPYPVSSLISHFLVSASARVIIPAGTWTMFVASDDGRILEMQGITFNAVGGQNNLVGGGVGTSIIGYENPTGHANSRGSFTVLVETTVTLDAMFWEAGGGDSFELAVATGVESSISNFQLLEDGVFGWKVLAL